MAPVRPVIPDHELFARIGGGSYGDVYLARNVVGTWRAVKIVFRDRFTDPRPYEREFNGMQKFEPLSRSNEAFIDILQIGRNDEEGYFYYVMELADDAASAGPGSNAGFPAGEVQDGNTPTGKSAIRSAGFPTGESPAPAAPTGKSTGKSAVDPSTYVPRTLSKALLQRGRLPVSDCLDLGLTLNLGLAHLHRAGLIHRDIKPSNIIFVGGVPKLADIGLVIETAEARSYVGTEGFIPPEGPNSPQADLYSLGKVLYEAGMGKDRKDFPEPFTQLAEAPDATELLEFNAILLKACAANVKERYQSAEEMNADLALLQSGGSVRRQRKLAGQLRFVQHAGAIVTIFAAVIALGWWWQAGQTKRVTKLASEISMLAQQAQANAAEAGRNELIARQNLYAADINLTHQALLANNLAQARELLQKHIPQPGHPDLRGFEWRYLWEQSRSEELFSLRGQTDRARFVAFRPDGLALATGGKDGTVKIWELASRREIASLNVTGEVRSVSFLPKGDLLAVTTTNSVSLWDAPSLTPLRRLPDTGWFSPDGKYLLTASRSPRPASGILIASKLILLDAASGSVVRTLELPESWRHPWMGEAGSWVAFSQDGERLAIICADAIRLFSIPDFRETGVLTRSLSAGASSSPFVRFSPDNRTLATLDSTGFGVQLWNTASSSETRILPGHSGALRGASFSPDGSRLATCGADQTIKLWAVATGELVRTFRGQAEYVVFSPDGKLLASVAPNDGADGAVMLWDANAKPRREFFRDPLGPVGFNTDGELLAVGEDLKPVSVDPATFQVTPAGLLNVTNRRAEVSRLDLIRRKPGLLEERRYDPYLGNLSPDGRTLGLCDLAGQTLDFWDMRDGKLLCSVEATKPWVAFAPKRQLVATDTTNATTSVWQLPGGTLKWVFTNRVGTFQAIAFSPDENFIVTDEGTRMKLWRIDGEDVKPMLTFNPKRNSVIGLTFSPDGSLLATGEEGGPIKLWAMPSAREVGVLNGHTYSVFSLAFSPDGRTLASMCDDRTLRWWHVATRREMLRFETPKQDHYYFSLTFSPDGRALAARRVDDEGAITWVWHAPSLDEIARRAGTD